MSPAQAYWCPSLKLARAPRPPRVPRRAAVCPCPCPCRGCRRWPWRLSGDGVVSTVDCEVPVGRDLVRASWPAHGSGGLMVGGGEGEEVEGGVVCVSGRRGCGMYTGGRSHTRARNGQARCPKPAVARAGQPWGCPSPPSSPNHPPLRPTTSTHVPGCLPATRARERAATRVLCPPLPCRAQQRVPARQAPRTNPPELTADCTLQRLAEHVAGPGGAVLEEVPGQRTRRALAQHHGLHAHAPAAVRTRVRGRARDASTATTHH